MMKKVLVLTVVMLMALGCAANANYFWGAGAYDSTDSNYGAALTFGEFGADSTAAQGTSSQVVAYTAIVDGSNLLQKKWTTTPTDTWQIAVWTGANYAQDTVNLKIWSSPGPYMYTGDPMTLTVVNDPTGTYAAGTVLGKDIFSAVGGSSTAPWFQTELSVAKTTTPLDDALVLEFTSAVPEPGSMVAMLSGLVGLVGFGIRRRK